MDKNIRVTFWLLLNCCVIHSSVGKETMEWYSNKREAIVREMDTISTFQSSWSRVSRRQDKLLPFIQHPYPAGHQGAGRTRRDTGHNSGTAIYLDGSGQLLKLQQLSGNGILPRHNFTVQFWSKPEGGQGKYTPIIGLSDECERDSPNSRWTIGIKSLEHEPRNARFVFSLKTESSLAESHLLAHKPYDPHSWSHVAATYNGETMSIYVNGARISLGHEQKGTVFGKLEENCKVLVVGRNSVSMTYYRGKIDELRMWNRALDHAEVVSNMHRNIEQLEDDTTRVLTEEFDNLDKWKVKADNPVEVIVTDASLTSHHLHFEAPTCGQTVCDDPRAVLSYRDHPQLRRQKVLRYSVVNIADDNGDNPTVSNREIRDQHRALLKAFEPYNISFIFEPTNIRNSTLRKRVIIFDCNDYKIGNNECNKECQHSTTGNDGGDCDQVRSECWPGLLGNGRCDTECNKAYHNYDNGDCCIPGENTHLTCLEPWNPQKAYVNAEELKAELQLDSSDRINVFLIDASWWEHQLVGGIATFPWEKHVFSSLGGNVLHKSNFGRPGRLTSLVHELGHNLGLWHVHHGITEMQCEDACLETKASMLLGDLCSDTNPTPRNTKCSDPHPDHYSRFEDTCGLYLFEDTPYRNYMGYADDDCADHFTPQQVARMHCYLDLVYQPMRAMKAPSPIPVSPKVLHATVDSVQLVWMEPLGLDTSCDNDEAFSQYADVAVSSHGGISWSPQEATGIPDAERCQPSPRAWMPYFPDTCTGNSCWLELGFKQPVVPKRLSVWVADIVPDVQLVVDLLTVDGELVKVGSVQAYCDMEMTLLIKTDKTVDKVRLYTSDPYVAIDAVQLMSVSSHPSCVKRKLPKYKLTRQPPFSSGYVMTADSQYTDSEVERNTRYQYRVQSILESRASELSPALTYTHGHSFCGDGQVDRDGGEECDDGNGRDGDGCSLDCLLEEHFACVGTPSLCYVYAGDGICEDFERGVVEEDCGFFTPDGFSDQWVTSAFANPMFQLPECPESLVAGPPSQRLECSGQPDLSRAWRPCGELEDFVGDFWIEAYVSKPVITTEVLIHLGSDGFTPFSSEVKVIHVDLIDENDGYVPLFPLDISVSCWENPVRVSVTQDLSQPFFRSKGVRLRFSYSSISIAGIRLRSSHYIDPLTLASCAEDELYNAVSGLCSRQSCSRSSCGPYPIKYGEADCTGSLEGDTCTILCQPGYTTGTYDKTAVCRGGSWVSSAVGSVLTCSPVDCKRPHVAHATVACPDGTTFPHACHFKCDRPAMLDGTDTNLRCQPNGRWTEHKARCHVICDALPEHFYQKGELKTPACLDGPQRAGKVCKVRCKDGYHVEGERNRRRALRVECGTDGRWDGLTCVRNQCPSIANVFSGAYSCTDGRYSGSTCTMSCPGNLGVVQTISCGLDGAWDTSFTICPALLDQACGPLPPVDNLRYSCTGETNVGASCNVSCSDVNSVPIRKQITEEENGELRTFTHVFSLDCSVTLTWLPDPESVLCVKGCIPSIGDGICDAENNRLYCQWDGGDCCKSTVDGGEVITLPEHCPQDCLCKDPTAIENKRRRRRHKYSKYKVYQ